MSAFARLLIASAVVVSASAHAHAQAAAPRRVGVVPLQNLRGDAAMDWIGSGASETLTTKLAAVKGLVMIERVQISRVLREQDIKISQTDDAVAASKLGKLISAERIVVGSFAKAGTEILFNVRVVDVDTGVVLNTASVKASEAKVFDAMFELAEAVILSFDKKVVVVDKTPTARDAPKGERLELTESQRELMKEVGTANYQALEVWSKAIDLEANDPREALRLAGKAVELDPGFGAAYGSAGRSHARLSRYDLSAADYTKALRLLPKECAYYSGRANAYACMGRVDEAMADLGKALELNDQAAYVYHTRAFVLTQQGKLKEALADADRAIELDPSVPDRYALRAQIRALGGDLDKALADAQHAVKTAPSNPIGFATRAFVYNRGRKHEQAIADYTKAIELAPWLAEAYHNRGNIWYTRDEYDKAIADYTKAVELNPLYFEAWKFRGLCFYNQKDRVKALADFDKAVAINGQDGQLLSFRAKTHFLLDNYVKARDDIQKAEKLGVAVEDSLKNAVRIAIERGQ